MHHDDTTPNQPGEAGDAWIESLLRRPVDPAAAGSDDAAAFTARVISALPPGRGDDLPPVRVHSRTHRTLAIAIGAMLGCAAAWALGGGVVIESARTTGELVREAARNIHDPDTAVAYTFAGASLAAMLLLAGRGSMRRLFS